MLFLQLQLCCTNFAGAPAGPATCDQGSSSVKARHRKSGQSKREAQACWQRRQRGAADGRNRAQEGRAMPSRTCSAEKTRTQGRAGACAAPAGVLPPGASQQGLSPVECHRDWVGHLQGARDRGIRGCTSSLPSRGLCSRGKRCICNSTHATYIVAGHAPGGEQRGLTGGMPAAFIAASMYGPKCSMSTYVFCRGGGWHLTAGHLRSLV